MPTDRPRLTQADLLAAEERLRGHPSCPHVDRERPIKGPNLGGGAHNVYCGECAFALMFPGERMESGELP